MKDWFPHDYYATRDLAIVRLLMRFGARGYGCFWLTIELMHSNISITRSVLIDVLKHTFPDLQSETIDMRNEVIDEAERIVDFMVESGLLKLDRSIINEDGDLTIYSDRVLRNKHEREAIADSKRNAAAKRWKSDDKGPAAPKVGKQERGGFVLNGGSPIPPMVNGMFVVVDDATKEYAQSISNAGAMPLQDITLQDKTEQISKDVTSLGTEVVADSPIVISFSCIANKLFHVKQSDIDEMSGIYPNVDILGELRKMYVWITVNPTKKKTTRGMPRFVHNWLGKAQDNGTRTINTTAIAVRSSKIGERKSEFSTEQYDAQILELSSRVIEGGDHQERQGTAPLREAGTEDRT